MFNKFIFFTILILSVSAWAQDQKGIKKSLFTDSEIQSFREKIKKTTQIPAQAIDILFDFYKNNRASTGGLKDQSCIDKNEYKIRWQDPKVTKPYLKSGIENEECLCVIDYTRPKTEERGHCIFLSKNSDPVIENFLTAHGGGSVEVDGSPTTFTNLLKPTGTTLSGLFITSKETYKFQGNVPVYGRYTSTGLSLYGVENTNWTAANVSKVTHGAPYVIPGPQKSVGTSLGCPAMPMELSKKLLPRCIGKAAWLNYTHYSKTKKSTELESCK